uniref:Chromatin assembly factor 1 subunit C, putative n=1 Tax=Babesia bovis TaxID=5865 RepID=S6B3E3_BABBO|nr:chromatin assembly factor 1 subunit C, putative [Babesia bovis]
MDEERRNWVVNTQVLYNFISCISLPHQPLSVDFLPSLPWSRENVGGISFQHIACGFQGDPDDRTSIYVIEVALPSEPIKNDIRRYSKCVDYEGFPLPGFREPMYQSVSKGSLGCDINSLRSHRYGDKCLLAAKSRDVYLYDIGSSITEKPEMVPILTFKDHEKDGYGLSFHKNEPILGSCSEDCIVNIWDVDAGRLTYNFQYHELLNSIEFLDHERRCLVSSDGGHVLVLDFNSPEPVAKTAAVSGAINALTNHYLNPDLFFTGSTIGTIHIWDYRRLDLPIHEIKAHGSTIIRLQVNGLCPTLPGSAAEDGCVRIFDPEAVHSDFEVDDGGDDAEDDSDPKELIFTHTGHDDQVFDFCWSNAVTTEAFIASVGGDYGLQLWQISDNVVSYSDEEDDGST